MTWRQSCIPALLLVISCGDDADTGTTEGGSAASSSSTSGGAGSDGSAGATSTANPGSSSATGDSGNTSDVSSTGPADGSTDSSGGEASNCDYEAVDSIVIIEAESLPVGEDWQVLTEQTGYYAAGYIGWTGSSFNGDPTHGVTSVTLGIDQPGRYRLQWRNRIGMGTNTTEHNDTWVKFPDAADYFGLQMQGTDERRVYPRPRCEDAAAMAAIEALPQVIAVDCVEGASADDWFKVYSSGANDWSWSTRTNDNNGYDVIVEFDAPGDYTFSIAARGDWHLIDRIVIHEAALDIAAAQDPMAPETACP